MRTERVLVHDAVDDVAPPPRRVLWTAFLSRLQARLRSVRLLPELLRFAAVFATLAVALTTFEMLAPERAEGVSQIRALAMLLVALIAGSSAYLAATSVLHLSAVAPGTRPERNQQPAGEHY